MTCGTQLVLEKEEGRVRQQMAPEELAARVYGVWTWGGGWERVHKAN